VHIGEYNPFGVIPDELSAADHGGNFLELYSTRRCHSGALAINIGGRVIYPGFRWLEPDYPLVIASEAQFFLPTRPDQPVIQSELRYARSEDVISAVFLLDATEIILRQPAAASYFEGPEAFDSIAVESSASRPYRRRHSLVYGDCEGYHRGVGSGLRPDLIEHNSMSPGRASSVECAPNSISLQINEILPQGSYGSDGQSIPGDEFIELIWSDALAPPSDHGVAVRLRIQPEGNNSIREYLLPLPESDFLSNHRFLTLMRSAPACFDTNAGLIIWPALVLPNGPARYTLHATEGSLLQSLFLDGTNFARMNGRPRYSLARVSDLLPAIWRIGDGTQADRFPCAVFATPGTPNSFRPFLIPTHEGTYTRSFQFQGDGAGSNATLRSRVWSSAPDGLQSVLFEQTITVQSAQSFSIQAPARIFDHTDRLILTVRDVTAEPDDFLFVGEIHAARTPLIISAVAPVPESNAVEWVRVCSPDGFDLRDYGPNASLRLHDSSSVDAIVPCDQRSDCRP
ncbi:MAG: hypothetical protein KDK34_06965, partial [Leptospiraceae bacterium]|nr:hypothetical protein [Leptospiraceae bacterium]